MGDYSRVIGIDANGTPVALSRPPPAKKRVSFSVEAPEVKVTSRKSASEEVK